MATLQICYLKNGQVVCTAATTRTADSLQSSSKEDVLVPDPDKKKVKEDVDALLTEVLAERPEFFVMSYNPK